MKLLALRCGGLDADEGAMFTGEVSGRWIDIPVMTHLVETSEGVVVWDTGMHEACGHDMAGHFGERMGRWYAARFRPKVDETCHTAARVAQAGYEPDDVTLVLNSHLHFDHSGKNAAFGGARHLVRARELGYARSVAGFAPADWDVPAVEAGWDYDGAHDVFGDGALVLHSTPGHTPGHQVLQVTFPSGRSFVLLGDAAYSPDALESCNPQGRPWDTALATDSLHRIAELGRAGAELLVSHDRERWRDATEVTDLWSE